MRRALAYTCIICASIVPFAGCGSSSTTQSSSTPSPTQYDNAQKIGAYVLALNTIEAPFRKPPADPTDLARARRLLQSSLRKLEALQPPEQLRATHARLIRGQRGELRALSVMERARAAHDAVKVNNAEAQDVAAEHVGREALVQSDAVIEKCKRNGYSC